MRRFLLLAMLAISGVALGQELRIKGHALGETVDEFVRIEPPMRKTLNRCTAPCNTSFSMLTSHGSIIFMFVNGRLTGIGMYLLRDEYETTRDDMSARLGVSPIEASISMQNGFGAAWVDRRAEWNTALYYADLDEINTPGRSHVFLHVDTMEHHKAIEAAAKNKPSPLD